jgi:hypothetical protein
MPQEWVILHWSSFEEVQAVFFCNDILSQIGVIIVVAATVIITAG